MVSKFKADLKVIKKIWIKLKQADLYFWFGLILLCLLLFKNPFSGQNIISDLEPLPDTIHYLNATQSFLDGQGLKITYQGRQLNTSVPPLYSLVTAPFLKIFSDPRAFYFANVILSLTSALFFYRIVSRLIKSYPLRAVTFLSLITSSIIFWYPSVAMAENLLITLVILSIWVFLQPLSPAMIIILSLLAISFYATKYTALVISLSLVFAMLLKAKAVFKTKEFFRLFGLAVLILGVSLLGINFIEYQNKGLTGINSILTNILNLIGSLKNINANQASWTPFSSDFSLNHFNDNLISYLFGLVGGSVPVAGKELAILPVLFGFVSLIGLFVNFFVKKNRSVNLYFLLSVLGTVISICLYNTNDARYLFSLVPILILSAGLFTDQLVSFFFRKQRSLYGYVVILVCFAALAVNVWGSILNQLRLNFVDSEPSLTYETVQVFNNYFSQTRFSQKPVVISTLPPYIIDFYSKGQYEILPLSGVQYFTDTPDITWGIKKGVKFSEIYRDKLNAGSPLFVSDYRTAGYFYGADFERLKQEFVLIEVAKGCQNRCNLYQVKLI